MSDPASLPPADAERAQAIVARYRDRIAEGLRDALNYPGLEHVRYMRYHLGWEDTEGRATGEGAGKMLRPAMCLLACEAAGGNASRALPAAVAIELLHNFTLIHDDIEDGSESRHGRRTLWTVVGVAQAINTGDGMYALAHRTLLRLADAGVPPERVLDAARILDDASIALCEGQHSDLIFETRSSVSLDEYQSMIAGKTSALLGASMAIGAVAAGADRATVEAFASSGILLGLAFQVQDDVLGIWGEPDVTGKSAGDDIRARKKSFPVAYAMSHLDPETRDELERIYSAEGIGAQDVATVLALLERAGAREAARSAATRWAEAALDALRPLRLDSERRSDIEALASFFVHRTA